MRQFNVKRLVLAAMFLAIAFVLPFLTGQTKLAGKALLPMHIPVLMCGMMCGWSYGLVVGFLAPILRSLMLGMPPLFPLALVMAFELAAYGAFAGLFLSFLRKGVLSLYIALIGSMLAGRVVYGIVGFIFYRLAGADFTWAYFVAEAFVGAVVGIIIQVLVVPPLVFLLGSIPGIPAPVWRAKA